MINGVDVTEADYDMIFLSFLSVPLLEENSLIAGAARAEKVTCGILVQSLGCDCQE